MRTIIGILSVLCFNLMNAQEQDTAKDDAASKELEKQKQQAKTYTYQGNKKLQSNKFNDAEADYRRAISTNPDSGAAKYNLGNAYYNRQSLAEAFDRFKQAAEVTTEKPDKHRAFHNMGNVFMKEKQYDKAVEAYKNALRNNPTDDETRYNLALAKQKKKEQDKNGGGGDNKDDQEEKKDDKNQGDKKKEGDKNDDNEGDKKDENKEGDGENEKKPEEPKDNEGDKKPEDKKDQKDKNKGGDQPKDKDKKPPKPRPGQLSPQQIKNLLQAMNNEEKKVQQKINAKKAKGAKVKNEKDW